MKCCCALVALLFSGSGAFQLSVPWSPGSAALQVSSLEPGCPLVLPGHTLLQTDAQGQPVNFIAQQQKVEARQHALHWAMHWGCVEACGPHPVSAMCVTECEVEMYQCIDNVGPGDTQIGIDKCQGKLLSGIAKKNGVKVGLGGGSPKVAAPSSLPSWTSQVGAIGKQAIAKVTGEPDALGYDVVKDDGKNVEDVADNLADQVLNPIAEQVMKKDPEVAYAKKGVKKEVKKEVKAPAPAKAEKHKLEIKAPAPAPDKKKAEDKKKIEDAKKFKKAAEDDIAKKVKKAAEDEKKTEDQKKTEDEKKDKRDKRIKKRAENKKSEHKSSVATEFDDFLPGCLIHTAEVVQKIDHSYTDAQLKTVLKHECLLSQEFPTVSDAFFSTHSACMDFAEFLDKARDEELTSGSTKGYTTFCKKFFEHVSGRDYTQTVGNTGSKSAASGLGLNWGLASLAVVLVARLM